LGGILDRSVRDAVLRRLGVPEPSVDLAGLTAIYRRWCESVPFDNTRKLIHVRAGDPGPLPGDVPDDFFASWLEHGTGGTCWAGNGALHALLRSLGFEAHRGIATMMVAPDLPPNHGTVAVDVDEGRFLVDASMLHGEPLPLRDTTTRIDHFAWGVEAVPGADGRTAVHWYPFHLEAGMDCRIERFGASEADFRELHEATRTWSPFNYSLCLRRVRGDAMIGFWFGRYGERAAAGTRRYEDVEPSVRRRVLCDDVGLSARLVDAVPADREVPPPPRPG
jgi:N-hydroxyarylamine O-acetyltransferase